MIVEIDGQQYDVPDDVTDDELNQLFPAPAAAAPAAPAAPAQPEGWSDWAARQGRGVTESLNRMGTRALTGPVDLPLAIGDALRNYFAGKIPGVTPSQGHNIGNAWLDATNTPRQAATAPGRFVEGMGTAALSGGMSGSSGFLGNVVRLAGMEATGEAGQAVGQRFGGDIGGIAGALLAPGALPVLARGAQYAGMQAVAPTLRRNENAPLNSQQIYDAAEATGVTPTAGLVGNQAAARLERAIGEVPFLGAGVKRAIENQKTDFDNSINRTGDAIQGDGPPVTPDVQSIGGTIQDAAGPAAARRLNEFGQERTGIISEAGESLPVDVGGTFNRAAALRDKDGASIAPGLNRVKGLLRSDKIETPQDRADVVPPPAAPVAPAGDIRLTPQQAQEVIRVFGNDPKIDPAALGAPGGSPVEYTAPIGPTRPEVPLSRLLGTRDAVGRNTSGERTLPKGAEKQLYGALTDDVKAAMDQVDPELSGRWTDFNQRYSTAMARELTSEGGDLRFMQDLGDRRTTRPDEVQRLVFGNKNNPVPMQAVSQNAPKAYQGAAAGQYLMEAGPTNGGRTGYAEFSPNTFLTNMSARERGGTLVPLVGDQAPRVYDQMDVAQAFRDAGRQENASGTAGTAFVQYALTNPASAIANLPQGALAGLFATSVLSNPEFAAAIAGRSKGIVPYVDLPRGVRTGYAAGNSALADLYASSP